MGRRRISMLPAASAAAEVFGQQVTLARHRRKWTMTELAERAGVSYGTVRSIESGSPTVSLGNAFNVAATAGVPLFSLSDDELRRTRIEGRERLALLPSRVDTPREQDDDGDFDF